MAITNIETNDVYCKVLYFGAKGAGTTENLRSIYRQTSEKAQTGLVELKSDFGDTPFFDFLPLSAGQFQGARICLHLFTLADSELFPIARKVLLRGLDAVVFVVDSRIEAVSSNLSAFEECKAIIDEFSPSHLKTPLIIQYNHRDHGDALAVELLRETFNQDRAADFEVVATEDRGVLQTLDAVIQKIYGTLEKAAEVPTLTPEVSHVLPHPLSY